MMASAVNASRQLSASNTTTAMLTVDRPFRSRLEVRDGKRLVSLRVGDLDYLGEQSGDEPATGHD